MSNIKLVQDYHMSNIKLFQRIYVPFYSMINIQNSILFFVFSIYKLKMNIYLNKKSIRYLAVKLILSNCFLWNDNVFFQAKVEAIKSTKKTPTLICCFKNEPFSSWFDCKIIFTKFIPNNENFKIIWRKNRQA
jgi:hypothetical protein